MGKENGQAAEENRGYEKGRTAEENRGYRNGRTGVEGREGVEGRAGVSGGRAHITTAQRTRIQETIRNTHVENVGHVNFALNVGTRIPEGYHLYPLPPELVSIVPEYRGFEYIEAEDELVIVDPASGEIVDIIPL